MSKVKRWTLCSTKADETNNWEGAAFTLSSKVIVKKSYHPFIQEILPKNIFKDTGKVSNFKSEEPGEGMTRKDKKTLIRENTFGKEDSDLRRELSGEKIGVLAEEKLGVETQGRVKMEEKEEKKENSEMCIECAVGESGNETKVGLDEAKEERENDTKVEERREMRGEKCGAAEASGVSLVEKEEEFTQL